MKSRILDYLYELQGIKVISIDELNFMEVTLGGWMQIRVAAHAMWR